jgi:hypothetical protein
MVCRRVRRREPFSNILCHLDPCGKFSVFTMQVIEVADPEHFISSMFGILFVLLTISLVLFIISLVLFTTSLVLFNISLVLFTISLVLFAISSVFSSIPSVLSATSPMMLAIGTLDFAGAR